MIIIGSFPTVFILIGLIIFALQKQKENCEVRKAGRTPTPNYIGIFVVIILESGQSSHLVI
jgi:hypothetical protein